TPQMRHLPCCFREFHSPLPGLDLCVNHLPGTCIGGARCLPPMLHTGLFSRAPDGAAAIATLAILHGTSQSASHVEIP
ncbi:MAG: hypothetical protein ACRD4F_15265, partial [Candidatus Angelobacter sp.]